MSNKTQLDFSRDLIKGRIAEVIFEQMIREEKKYTVIPFGYEHTVPTLTQYKHILDVPKVIDNISEAPDFALISEDKTKIYLVEVKYRQNFDFNEIKNHAHKLLKHWEFSWIFVATPDCFYCMPCNTFENSNYMHKLSENWVTKERQEDYLKLLNEFENK
jgi:hypothetical protein